MKNIAYAILFCTTFSAVIIYADGKQYPWIKKYAPEKIREWCAPGWGASCDALDKAMWCAYQHAKASSDEKVPREVKRYCFPCEAAIMSGGLYNIVDLQDIAIANTLQYIASELQLSHEEAAELIKQFDYSMHAIETDAKTNPTTKDS